MIKLNFPDFEFKLKKIDSKTFIFDFLRKKYFLLTPEEWVRQHVLNFLVLKKIPVTHIAVEKKIIFNNLNKRFDVVIYNNIGNVIMLIECKSPSVELTQNVFDQISIYNMKLNSKYSNQILEYLQNNLKKLDSKVDLISVIGNCQTSSDIQDLLVEIGVDTKYLIKQKNRIVSKKAQDLFNSQQDIYNCRSRAD